MKFHYEKYRKKPDWNWPSAPVASSKNVIEHERVLEVLKEINELTARLFGYGPVYRPHYREIGALEGIRRARLFRLDNGMQYCALGTAEGPLLTAEEIADAAFSGWLCRIRNPRSIRAIQVKEADVLHLAVDADFEWRVKPSQLADMPSYTAEII